MPAVRIIRIHSYVGLSTVTNRTITDVNELFAELEEVRKQGYAVNEGEITEGSHSVGAPLVRPDGSVLDALSVSGPAHRPEGKWFETEIPNLILGATNEIELNVTFS